MNWWGRDRREWWRRHQTPSFPQVGRHTVLKAKLFLTKFRGIIAGHSFAVSFNERETSPSLIKVKEGEELRLKCSYCVNSSKEDATLSWYKDGHVIDHGIKNHSAVLGVPVAQHNRDEGLYECLVTYKEQNISKFITVIVNKGGFFRICFRNAHSRRHGTLCTSCKH